MVRVNALTPRANREASAVDGEDWPASSATLGFWIILPAYMIYAFGTDILQGLSVAGDDHSSKPAEFTKPGAIPFSKDPTPMKRE
ncbi:MAG: hypothetical protein Q9206_002742 [Seirophora lacunosa]